VCGPGGACAEKDCGKTVCGADEACPAKNAKRCAGLSCVGVSCPDGQECFFGQCRNKDCGGRSCGGSVCYDGFYCKDCPKEKCGEQQVCVDGTCQSLGCLAKPQKLCDNACARPPLGVGCGRAEICVDGVCVRKHCEERRCPEGSVCQGSSCAPRGCVGVTCGAGEACAADGKCYSRACATRTCAEGFVCVAGACAAASCVDVACGPGLTCFGGGCYRSACGATQCQPGELCIASACRPGYSATGPVKCGKTECPDGYTCEGEECTPPECVGGICGGRCGSTFCPPGTHCFENLVCLAQCSGCPTGFVCSPRDLICIHLDCSGKPPCPEGTRCVPGGACEPILCGDETCDTYETCVNGACVDYTCKGKTCPSGDRCILGECFRKCCENFPCGPSGICIAGIQVHQNCTTHTCPNGFVCGGAETCIPIMGGGSGGGFQGCLPRGAESVYCDGTDSDCNGLSDDALSFGQSIIAGPKVLEGGYACGWCASMKPEDLSCAQSFFDVDSSAFLGLTAANKGERLSDPPGMTSCLTVNLPCEMKVTQVNIQFRGVDSVPCRPGDECGGNCPYSKLHVFTKAVNEAYWQNRCANIARLERGRMLTCSLGRKRVKQVALCRGNADTKHRNLAIDGVSVQGCCPK
jgi:hypothetical protein